MTETNTALETSARIMFITLNNTFQLHDLVQLEPEEGDKAIDACSHCSEIANAIIHYPCPTVQILTVSMAVQPDSEDEETPAE